MRKHTRATPAGVPRSRSKYTRAQRKSSRWIGCWMHYSGHYTFGVDVARGPSRSVCKIVYLLDLTRLDFPATPAGGLRERASALSQKWRHNGAFPLYADGQ